MKRLIGECRRRWNCFDPIGVVGEGDHLDDEYDSYLAHTAKLLMEGADAVKIAGHVRQVVRVNIGLSDFPDAKILEFAQELEGIRLE